MEIWMVLALLAVFGAALGCGVYLYLQNSLELKTADDFFYEAEQCLGYNFSEPIQAAQDYEAMKLNVWKKVQPQLNLPNSAFDPAENSPSNSWMRRLPKEAIHMLQHALMRRAIENIPRYLVMQKDSRAKLMLLSKQMISERQWSLLNEAQEDLSNEILAVKFEADCLVDGWGRTGAIFQEAMMIHQRQATQQHEQNTTDKTENAPVAVANTSTPTKKNVEPSDGGNADRHNSDHTSKGSPPRSKPVARKRSSGSKEGNTTSQGREQLDPVVTDLQRKKAEATIQALLEEEEKEKLLKGEKKKPIKSKKSLKKA